jgi:hypothetical protein
MILSGFSNVVKERGQEKRLRITEIKKDVCQKDIPFLVKGLQVSDGLKQVSADGEEMIVVELNPILDRFKLRDERTEKAALQHLIKCLEGIEPIQNGEKTASSSFGHPEGIIHQVQEFPDQPFGFQGKGPAGFCRLHEDVQQQKGIMENGGGGMEMDFPLFHVERGGEAFRLA